MEGYIFDGAVKLMLIGVYNGFEVVFIIVIFGVEIEDDSGELCYFFAHF